MRTLGPQLRGWCLQCVLRGWGCPWPGWPGIGILLGHVPISQCPDGPTSWKTSLKGSLNGIHQHHFQKTSPLHLLPCRRSPQTSAALPSSWEGRSARQEPALLVPLARNRVIRAEPQNTGEGLLLWGRFPAGHSTWRGRGCRAVGGSGAALFRLPAGPRCPRGSLRNPSCTKPGLAGAQTPPAAGGRSSQCLPAAALPRNEEDRRSGELRDGGGGPGGCCGKD